MRTFEKVKVTIGDNVVESIKMIDEDGVTWSVPMDPANSDYQQYLEWLAEQEEQA